MLMVGGNDIGPRGEFQFLFTAAILFLGAIINSIIFGNMAVILQSFNLKSTTFNSKIESANDAMKNLNILDDLKDDVEYYLTYSLSSFDSQAELDGFMAMLSPSLKKKVTQHNFEISIMKSPIFRGQTEALKDIIDKLTAKVFLPEDEIIRQNQNGFSMFFLSRGE